MRRLLNTLYITSENRYLSLDGENVVVLCEGDEVGRFPLHNLEAIVSFGYTGASPALMGKCAQMQIDLAFHTMHGRFLARVVGEEYGNVVLRKTQYRVSDEEAASLSLAKNIVGAKLFNSRWVLERFIRDHGAQLDAEKVKAASASLRETIKRVECCGDLAELRGMEGLAARAYFSVFDELILQQKEDFMYLGRNRRPPLDLVNALLSFCYSLLTNETAAALRAVGLDPYVGVYHVDRPGRLSLALDILEEFRAVSVDRFVLALINRKMVTAAGFAKRENGAVVMDDDTRKTVLTAWQKRKQEMLTHPFLQEKMPWGLAPFAQAQLLSRFLRGDLDAYPSFFWK